LYTALTDSIPVLAITGQNVRAQLDRDAFQAVDIVAQGQIKPVVSQTFPLEEAEKAHQLIQENKITGRAALII
jgi:tartronate-semialdehyde synthase